MKERWGSKSVSSVGSKEKSGSGTIAEDDREPPIDKCWIVFMIILLNGIGVLLPWNMFITIAPNYYVEYWFTVDGNKTSYAKSFMSALGISAQIPNFIVGVINVAQIIGGSLMIRIVGPLTLNCLNVVAILALNSVFGLAADFPAAYTNALVVGNNVCGTFTSVLAILTTVGPFLLADLKEFYQFYVEKGNRFRAAENAGRPTIRQFLECFKGCWMQLLSIILVFFVTLSVFPTVLAGTTPNGKGEPWNSGISKELYPGITTFLVFNFFAAVGSTTANFIQFPGPRLLIFPVLARLLFIPFFMLCNYNVDDRVMPVWFKNEWFFIIGNVIMALSSGYFSSLGMMYAPRHNGWRSVHASDHFNGEQHRIEILVTIRK
ncbi:nucleoside transporter [Ancylostoma ceylanicum]|uniref:Nucleoside transporter n=1 Tax=Ancylostoma ceylanicum TaxID=53326 RepID=A0A0D6MBV5_9BILA|nr:nucleoside transporter [Ancylostoma ceylanicum]